MTHPSKACCLRLYVLRSHVQVWHWGEAQQLTSRTFLPTCVCYFAKRRTAASCTFISVTASAWIRRYGNDPLPYPQDPDGLPCHALAMAPPSHQGRYDEQECTFRSSTQLPPLPLMLTREGAYLIYDVALAFEGTTDAQVQLAHCHMTGSGTLNSEPNFAEAVRLLQLASKRNDPVALANLAGMYARGLGLDQDKVEAVRLYKLAAQSGHPPSQFNFGMMNMKGQGMRKDLKEAVSCT